MFGVELSLEELVTERIPPLRKVWETMGKPRLLVIGHYCMRFNIAPQKHGSSFAVFIDYAKPDRIRALALHFLR